MISNDYCKINQDDTDHPFIFKLKVDNDKVSLYRMKHSHIPEKEQQNQIDIMLTLLIHRFLPN